MSQVFLGRPEFVPGTPPGHPTAKFLHSGKEETHKHKRIGGIVPALGGCQNFVYVFFRVIPYGGEKHINKIPPRIPGQSRENFVYVFFSLCAFRSLIHVIFLYRFFSLLIVRGYLRPRPWDVPDKDFLQGAFCGKFCRGLEQAMHPAIWVGTSRDQNDFIQRRRHDNKQYELVFLRGGGGGIGGREVNRPKHCFS